MISPEESRRGRIARRAFMNQYGEEPWLKSAIIMKAFNGEAGIFIDVDKAHVTPDSVPKQSCGINIFPLFV